MNNYIDKIDNIMSEIENLRVENKQQGQTIRKLMRKNELYEKIIKDNKKGNDILIENYELYINYLLGILEKNGIKTKGEII